MTEYNRNQAIDEVVTVRRLKGHAEITDAKGMRMFVPPSLYFATKTERHPGDKLQIFSDEHGVVHEIVKEVDDGFGKKRHLRIYPFYQRCEAIQIGLFTIRVGIREVDTSSIDYDDLRTLNEFHYLPTRSTWGRQTLLGAWMTGIPEGIPMVPENPIGYLLISSPGLVSGARNRVLGWGKQLSIANADRIARIARIVVHPEFRGLGIGRLLVRNAICYVGERWNVAGKSAWYVECIAEMGRYHPVFEKAGMHFAGETLGQRSTPKRLDTKGLRDTSQGVGHFRASMARYEVENHASKPYYIAAVQPQLEASLIEQVKTVGCAAAAAVRIVTNTAPAIQLVSVSYSPTSLSTPNPIDAAVRHLEAGRTSLGDAVTRVLATASKLDNELQRVATELQASSEAVAVDRVALHDAHQEAVRQLRTLTEVVSGVAPREVELGRGTTNLTQALASLVSLLSAASARLDRRHSNENAAEDTADWSLEEARQRLVELRNSLGHLRTSEREKWVRQSFGDRATFGPPVLKNLNWDFPARSVVLIAGPSGSGKTTLLKMLGGRLAPDQGYVSPGDMLEKAAWLDLDLPDTHALVDTIGSDINESVRLLNLVGMGEASLYLKRPSQLSHGQLYRAALAKIACSGSSVWIADEFCSSLDPITAAIVARAFGRLARELRASLFVATARPDIVGPCLEPDITLHLSLGGRVIPSPELTIWRTPLIVETLVQELEQIEEGGKSDSEHSKSLGLVARPTTPGDPVKLRSHGMELLREARGNLRSGMLFVCKLLWLRDLVFHRLFPPPNMWAESLPPENAELPGVPWVGRFLAHQVELRRQVVDQLRE